MHSTKKIIFIFRRDLRIQDNTGLKKALALGTVYPLFIFDPRQVGDDNEYKSSHALSFMLSALKELSHSISEQGGTLSFGYGKAEEVIQEILTHNKIDAIVHNADYTPFSNHRDTALKKIAEQQLIEYHTIHDACLNAPGSILTGAHTPYKVFTPFYNASRTKPVDKPWQKLSGLFSKTILAKTSDTIPTSVTYQQLTSHAGRTQAIKILNNLASYKKYETNRDIPALDQTTHLSAHLKFGTVSVRECWWAIHDTLGADHPLLRQLYWRDFWVHTAFSFPHVFGKPFIPELETLSWNNDKELFKKWCDGQTGFPLVDAGMRELNTTGFMHNRVRMIVASFLVKDLHINWLWGERYFAQHLQDYDPAVNNGNWQWAASTGCDPQPYFRIFNPWLQQKKFDPECSYIKKWIPELANVPSSVIHAWHKSTTTHRTTYPRPIVDHAKESKAAKALFSHALSKN